MPVVNDPELYQKAKDQVDKIYKKNSAYRSGMYVKTYKDMGGTYSEDDQPKKLKQWYQEKWQDVGHRSYPTYRPTIRVNASTPLTVHEIDRDNLKKQIKLKQKIQGLKNLPPFVKRS